MQEVIEDDIDGFRMVMERTLKPSSISNHLSAIKSFYKWMTQNSHIMINPTAELKTNVKIDYLPEVLTCRQMTKLFDCLPKNTATAKRNRAMLELSYSCLLRRAELVNIKISDISLTDRVLRVIRKGDIEAILPLGTLAADAIKDYTHNERPDSESSYLWLSTKSSEKIGYRAIEDIFTQIRKDTGYKLSLHTLRRSGATHMLQCGASLQVIQEMLSHSNLKAVKHYLRLCVKDQHKTLKKSEWLK